MLPLCSASQTTPKSRALRNTPQRQFRHPQNRSSIWLHKTIKEDYILTAQSAHKAVAAPLGTSYAPINAWVAGATEGKITDLLQGAPDPLVRAVLVNAVYFKGSWASEV